MPNDPASISYVRGIVARGEAAKADAHGKLPFGKTHEVSRAVEFHRRALAEPDVRLAPHPAPIVQPRP